MRRDVSLSAALVGLAPLVSAQRFGFTHGMVPPSRDYSVALALGDVDGDGDLDAFVGTTGNYGGMSNRLALNDGTGVLVDATGTNLPVPPVLPFVASAVALGDLDGDGDLDAFLALDAVLRNDGTGVFSDVTAASLPVVSAFSALSLAIALGDVDGDGDLDAYRGDLLADGLYLNGGAGIYSDVSGTNLPASAANTRAVALGDVDGDGDLDAILGSEGNSPSSGGVPSRLCLNDGAGVFTDVSATNLPPGLDRTRSIATGDVDGDGDLDAFVRNGATIYSTSPFPDRLLLNGGAGTFVDASATNLPPLSWFDGSVALGDLDGDGDLDAVLGADGPDRLYANVGAGIFAYVPTAILSPLDDDTRGVALGDLDGDGDLDALTANLWAQHRLFLNDGSAGFVDVTGSDLPDEFGRVRVIALGDVDGDGDSDAFLARDAPGLYLNGGDGTFLDLSAANLPPTIGTLGAVALGDVDGDGDLDAWIGTRAGVPVGQDRLYRNDGAGIFSDVTSTSVPVLFDDTWSVALGDVDGDGDLDAYVGNQGQDRLHLNDGSGVFTNVTATALPALGDSTTSVALGDVDGDGDLDALVGNQGIVSGAQNRLFLNGGTGVFTDVTATNLPAILDSTTSVALGDVDGDGDLDAFSANADIYLPFAPEPVRFLQNVGSAIFADATASNLPVLLDASWVALGDVDEDGDLDAFVGLGRPDGAQNRLCENDGAGIFSDVTATALPALIDLTSTVALGDLDGDGDLDAYSGPAYGQSRIWRNLTRHLAWRGIPRAGKSLDLDVRGPASGFWLLAASTGTSSVPVPPFGTLRLLPADLFAVAAGALDPQGGASVSFLVPPNPGLVGLSAYWQAMVGLPFRLTNLEVTTVTSL